MKIMFDLVYFRLEWLAFVSHYLYEGIEEAMNCNTGCSRCGEIADFAIEKRKYCSPCYQTLLHKATKKLNYQIPIRNQQT